MTGTADRDEILRLSPSDVAARIEESMRGAPIALVDVREPYEYEAGRLPNSIHIPVGSLEARLAEIPRDRPVIFICRSGGRSMAACQLAVDAGIANPANLEGGLRAWSHDIDPSLVVL